MALPFFQKPAPPLTGMRVLLRPPKSGDYAEWAAIRRESRAFLEPWEPSWARDELEKSAFRERLSRYAKERKEGSGHVYFIFLNDSGQLIGGITLGHIKRGVAQSGVIGYWMGAALCRTGVYERSCRCD